MDRLGRAIGLVVAAIFVFEAWVWDGVVRFGRRVVDHPGEGGAWTVKAGQAD